MASLSKQHALGARLRYWLENLLAQGMLAQVGLLSLVSGVAVLFAVGLLVGGIHPREATPLGLSDAVWIALAHIFDGGTMGNDPPGAGYRGIMLGLTLFGLLVVSALVGLLTTGLVEQLEQLRRGRSLVLEREHTLILGWSPAVFTIVAELVVANEHRRRPAIVILADRDKLAMEDELRAKVARFGNTRVICRSGSPIDLDDLAIVNPNGARSVIVLSPEGEDADTQVIKTILALVNGPERKSEPFHIVAEIREPKKREVAKLVGGDEVEVILASEVITRLTVQTCFQSGLSIVYQELFDFDGDEIYLHAEPQLVGRTFHEALLAFEASTVIGLVHADGRIALNPPMDLRIAAGDRLFVIARDQQSINFAGPARGDLDVAAIVEGPRQQAPGPRRTLILAWNHRVPYVIREMDYYVEPGSEVTVVADLAEPTEELAALEPFLHNQKVSYWRGDTTDRNILEALDIYTYDHVIVMGYTENLGQEEADARTLVTLLYLRALAEQTRAKANIVTEMLNVRNRDLARVTKVDDFIVSNKLVSLIMSQVSENKHLNAVFMDLLDAEGQEIYLKPVSDYVKTDRPVSFATLVEAAARRGEVALGYRRMGAAHRGGSMDGVVVNPTKGERLRFEADDRVIVLAEGDAA